MRYEFINEIDVDASADEVWAIYSSPDFCKLVVQILSCILESKDVVEGDGRSVGTILRVVFLPGHVPRMYKEKFVTIDDDKRLKEIEMIEGGYLEMGFTFCMLSFEILAKESNQCIIKTVMKYEINDEVATGVTAHLNNSLDTWVTLARGVSGHIAQQKASSTIN
ncbi:hypothetical protein MKX01_000664 [Papaver californicum]|nr:hypothetical protein MKX01_000664 [Papaver californicum]